MLIEESEESILACLLHSIDKSHFGTECIVVDYWGRRKRTLDDIVSYLKNAEQKRKSEKAKDRVLESVMIVRLQQQQPHHANVSNPQKTKVKKEMAEKAVTKSITLKQVAMI